MRRSRRPHLIRLAADRSTHAHPPARQTRIHLGRQRPPCRRASISTSFVATAGGPEPANAVRLPPELDYLCGDDVIAISDDGQRIRVLWRQQSRQNSILLTERCNHYCLMCSQPPKTAIDDHLLSQARELIRVLPRDIAEIGFTGGEPTLYGDDLIELLRLCRNLHPEAQVHVLSNAPGLPTRSSRPPGPRSTTRT